MYSKCYNSSTEEVYDMYQNVHRTNPHSGMLLKYFKNFYFI